MTISPHFRIEAYKDFEIPRGSGVIYEYYIPSIGKSYIGQTTDLLRRHREHRNHGKLAPYIASDDYILNVLEVVEVSKLDREERRFIADFHTQSPYGLNVSEGGRTFDLAPLVDFSSRVDWTFKNHDTEFRGENFTAKFYKDANGRFFTYIPEKVAESLLMIDGDEMSVSIDHRRCRWPRWT